MSAFFHCNLNRHLILYFKPVIAALLLGLMASLNNTAYGETYKLAIQPILSKENTIKFYQPLADFLSKVTGHDIQIHASTNFVSYWEELRTNNKYDLALDAAHFTDYRNKKFNYSVLAKITDTVSFSLVTNENVTYFDAEELVGHRIAAPASPSIAGVRLLSLFPHAMRQPVLVGTNNFSESLTKLKANAASAAMVPTSLVSGDITVNTILVTEPIPHMALSVSPRINQQTRSKIKAALLKANNTDTGRVLLSKLNLSGFERANNQVYEGYDQLLQGVWGFKD